MDDMQIFFSDSFQRASIVFVLTPHNQAEYLIIQKWPIVALHWWQRWDKTNFTYMYG